MTLHSVKRFIFLSFFSLLVCLPIVAQVSYKETDLPVEKIEPAKETEEPFDPTHQAKIEGVKYNFHSIEANPRHLEFDAATADFKYPAFEPKVAPEILFDEMKDDAKDAPDTATSGGFKYRAAITQSLMFLGVQHGYAILGQAKTRRALKGKFFKDYADSVKSLHGWSDGGRFFTNYIAHPMQGSLTGFVYVQNSPQATRQRFGASGDYWRSRMKAMLWTAAWSTQFEIGPVSQASIGNVGLKGKQTWEDIVTTPTLGTSMLITEDAVDRFITQRIERRTDNFYVKIFSRMLLSPTRVFANMLRFKEPWYRDRPYAH